MFLQRSHWSGCRGLLSSVKLVIPLWTKLECCNVSLRVIQVTAFPSKGLSKSPRLSWSTGMCTFFQNLCYKWADKELPWKQSRLWCLGNTPLRVAKLPFYSATDSLGLPRHQEDTSLFQRCWGNPWPPVHPPDSSSLTGVVLLWSWDGEGSETHTQTTIFLQVSQAHALSIMTIQSP